MKNKQGIIDYSPTVSDDSKNYLTTRKTVDGVAVYLGEIDDVIDRSFLGFDNFTISYHGLINYFNPTDITYSPRNIPHVSIITEELDNKLSTQIVEGTFVQNRKISDSLLNVLKKYDREHSIGYANMTKFSRRDNVEVRNSNPKISIKASRAIGDLTIRSLVVDFIQTEMAREDGRFISQGVVPTDELHAIISDSSTVTSYAMDDDGINSVVILGQSPSALPWFNEARIDKIAHDMKSKYSSVVLGFLALTSPDSRKRRVAPALFDLAIAEILEGDRDFIFCSECSPRSIAYTPYLTSRQLENNWGIRQTLTERTTAVVHSKTTS